MKKIGIPVDFFCQWEGGATLLSIITEALIASSKNKIELYFIAIDKKNDDLRFNRNKFEEVPKRSFAGHPNPIFRRFLLRSSLETIAVASDYEAALNNLNLDILGPIYGDFGGSLNIPTIGYLYDFQHMYFPEKFDQEEIQERNRTFRSILDTSTIILVNDPSVAKDAMKFFPETNPDKLKILPQFIPRLKQYPTPESLIRNIFGLNNQYFICCSQQWAHKRHDLVIQAFAKAKDKFDMPLDLVFTGLPEDYRNKLYHSQVNALIEELNVEKNIRYLGVVEKNDQLGLINNSIALIQASIFEGGPGSSGTMEAALLGVPILCSDIEPNLNLKIGTKFPFPSEDFSRLAELMVSNQIRKPRNWINSNLIDLENNSLQEEFCTIFLNAK